MKWIKVTDHEPEPEAPLHLVLNGELRTGYFYISEKHGTSWFVAHTDREYGGDEACDDGQVSHWMYYPKLPKGVKRS